MEAGSRIYYFDAFKDSKDNHYLIISEIPAGNSPRDNNSQRIVIHRQNFSEFAKTLNEIVADISNESSR